MISNGYKVIGIEENGNVEYDVMSSCPVTPSKPKFDGSVQKTISKEVQAAIKQFLSSNHPSYNVMESQPTIIEFDTDFMEILANKRIGKMKATNEQSLELDSSANRGLVSDANANEKTCERDESIGFEDEITDDLKNCSVDDDNDKPNESTFNENDFLELLSS